MCGAKQKERAANLADRRYATWQKSQKPCSASSTRAFIDTSASLHFRITETFSREVPLEALLIKVALGRICCPTHLYTLRHTQADLSKSRHLKMASPASSHGDDDGKKNLEQITFRFCSEWYVLMYVRNYHILIKFIAPICCTQRKTMKHIGCSSPVAHANIAKKLLRPAFSGTY